MKNIGDVKLDGVKLFLLFINISDENVRPEKQWKRAE